MLLQKYRPKTLSELAGNKSQVRKIIELIRSNKALVVVGPPGSGKTTAIDLICKELGLEKIDLNSDELRDYKSLKRTVISSSQQQSLFKKKKIIVLDEAETLSSSKGLNELIKMSKFPVVLIVNDIYDSSLRGIISKLNVVKFFKIRVDTVKSILTKIARQEKMKIDERTIEQIARKSNGDLRAAILDLESRNVDFYRDSLQNVFEVLGIIFKSSTYDNALSAIKNSDKDISELKWWIEENIPNEYEKPDEISKAFDVVSYEDFIEAQIKKRQSWGLMSYLYDILAGVSLCKNEKYRKFVRYAPPRRFKKNKMSPEDLEVIKKYASHVHMSVERFVKMLPSMKAIIKKLEIPKDEKKVLKKFV